MMLNMPELKAAAMPRPLSINRRKHGLRVRDVFFAANMDQLDSRGTDLVYSVQCSQPAPGCTEFYTSIVDLLQSADALHIGISKNFRYEIRRAEKDALRFEFIDAPTPTQIESFASYFNAFALAKSIAGANRVKLLQLAQLNGLHLAWVHGGDPERPLAVHAYIVDGIRARLYYSGTSATQDEPAPLRQLTGRANKALHWHCMQQYHGRGYQRYDLGGISMGETLKAIDEFKQQFGGVLIKEFNTIKAASISGRFALLLMNAYQASRRLGRPWSGM